MKIKQLEHIYNFVGAALAAKNGAKAAPTITPFCPGYLVTVPNASVIIMMGFGYRLYPFYKLYL